MIKRIVLFLILGFLFSNPLQAQQISKLVSWPEKTFPQWLEQINYRVTLDLDTVLVAKGQKVNETLLQMDHYSTAGYWVGVDRLVLESDSVLREYNYDGSEILSQWSDIGISKITVTQFEEEPEQYSFTYDGGLLKRIDYSNLEGLEEYVLIYNKEQLSRIKIYFNGREDANLLFSYNEDGFLVKEEYWAQGQLQKYANHYYSGEQLMAISQFISFGGNADLQKQWNYLYDANGAYTEHLQIYSDEKVGNILNHFTSFDPKGRILERTVQSEDKDIYVEDISIFRYSETIPQEEEGTVTVRSAGGR